uniref:Aminotransferase-like plant mobile domain-containing protein n=1 Tax=Fagus sylvatica TaxID=28930 RepID=A0A2N9IQ05_FAGSY
MVSSSSTTPVNPTPQLGTGERSETPEAALAASIEAAVDALAVRSSVPGGATPVALSPFFDEPGDPREGSFDFSCPVKDWDWTVSGSEVAVDQAWVPSLDEVSELLILKGNIQPVPINFDFLCAASKDWSHWVDLEILNLDFWDNLRDAGVHWSILISRSCNMFRDTEPLCEVLRRWCPSTHTFFFSWGELTPTLEDIANHWMPPVLGEHSFSNIELSAEEEVIAAALRKQSSTRLSGWPSHFTHHKEAPIHRAAFVLYWLCKCIFGNSPYYSINTVFIPLAIRISTGHCFPFAPLFLGHLYSHLDLFHDCEVEGDSCYILHATFNTTALQTFFWEHSLSYLFVARDKVAAWSRFSDLPQEFLDRFPDFRNNLPLVYRWVGLKTHDHDLVTALDYEENVLLRPYGDDYTGFACVSVFSRFYQPTSSIHDLRANDHRSLAYLSTVSKGFLPVLSTTGVSFIPYCPQRVQRQFGFDQDAGRSEKTPMSVHRKPLISYPCLSAPSQFAISYANSQRLGFTEWDEVRGGWIAYTIHIPQGWRSSITVVENRLIMPSKRGKGSKRDPSVDQAAEKAPKKPAPSPKQTPPKKTKARKKGKSTASASASEKESTTALIEKPTESTAAPSKTKSASASLSKKKPSRKSVGSRPPKSQKKASTSSSSLDEEPPSAALTSLSSKKKFVAPLFPLGAASRMRSKSGSKGTHKSGKSDDDVVDIEDSDMAVDEVITSSLGGDDLQTAAVDQDKNLGKSVADSPEAGAESTEGGHSSSSDSFFDTTPGSVPEEQLLSAGSTADDDDMSGADDSNIGSADLISHDLAIVPHASHSFGDGRDDGAAADSEALPLSFSVPQSVLTSGVTGFDAFMAHIMEGVSLFSATPRLRAIPTSGFVIPASRITSEAPLVAGSPIASEVLMPERVHAQDFMEGEPVVDLRVIPRASSNVDSAVDHGAQTEGANASAADMLVGSEHLENIDLAVVI